MSNNVPCTGNCGVSNHVAGSESHRLCQARTAAMAAHPAGKGRGTSEAVSSDFSETASDIGRRQAAEYLERLEDTVGVPPHYRDADEIRAEINKTDAEIERLVTPHEHDKYDSTYATNRRGGELSALYTHRSSLVTGLAEQSILVDKLGPEGFAEARQADRDKRKVFALRDVTEVPIHHDTDLARVEVLTEEAETLSDQVDDYATEHGDPWQDMRREWSNEIIGVTGGAYIEAEQARLQKALSKIGAEDLLNR